MTDSSGISWQPFDTMPNSRKDGRRVLLWSYAPWIGRWNTEGGGRWIVGVTEIAGVRFWADINPPE